MKSKTRTESIGRPVLPRPASQPDVEAEDDVQDPEAMANPPAHLPALTPEMEFAVDLDPTIKGMVLDAAFRARVLKLKRRDKAAAEKFFAANPLWSVRHIVELRERCENLGAVGAGFDPQWHAKHGGDLKFLLRNLPKILHDLGIADLPALSVLPADDLYKPRRSKRQTSGGS